MQENAEEIPPVIVESNPTVIIETPSEPVVVESEFSEDSLRAFQEWCDGIDARLAALEIALLGAAPGEHSHDGYATSEHEHGPTIHEHEEYALREHEHATPTREREDKPPKPTHLWSRPVGEIFG